MFLGFFVLIQSPKSKQNLSFFFGCLGIACWTLGLILFDLSQTFYWPDKLSLFGGMLMVGSFYVFSQVFPTDSRFKLKIRAPFKANTLVRLVPLTLLLFVLPFNLIVKRVDRVGGSFSPVNGPLFPLYALICGFYMIAAGYNFFLQYKNNIGYKRQRILYIAFGLIAFILVALVCDVILPAFSVTMWKFVGPISSSLFLVASGFSLISYNLMDIRLVLKSTLVNIFSFAIVTAAVSAGLEAFNAHIMSDSEAFGVLFLAAIIGFLAIRFCFNLLFKKLFMKDYYLFQDSFNELNMFLHEEVSTDKIILVANKYLQLGLGLNWIYYLNYQDHKIVSLLNHHPINDSSLSMEQVLNEQFISYISSSHAVKFFFGVEFEAFPNIANAPIAILPLWNKEILQGCFVLGPQKSLSGLSLDQTQKIQYVWAHIQTAFDRALLYNELEQKVRAQVQDIVYKNKKLKELIRNKLDFIQVTSHQLRTPITSLSGALQLVMDKKTGAEEREELVNLAYIKSKELAESITGILKIARLESAEDSNDTSEQVSLNLVFDALIPIIEAAARAKNITIDYSSGLDLKVRGNKLYLEQAFYNILENAIQHTSQGVIQISFAEDLDRITISIKDNGSGIPDSVRDKIFRKKVLEQSSGGNGLGLYIVKTIIEAHPEGQFGLNQLQQGPHSL
ncbi:MAG: sensor histidine kinase [Candidatus Doudnabacteria bacterium]|nr:sensor histidine kinase [Candidatus Doudnabacteria bacterium]